MVGTVLEGLDRFGLSHPGSKRSLYAHCEEDPFHEPPPYAWASKAELQSGRLGRFSEASALESGAFFDKGHELMKAFVGLVNALTGLRYFQ